MSVTTLPAEHLDELRCVYSSWRSGLQGFPLLRLHLTPCSDWPLFLVYSGLSPSLALTA